MLEAIWGKNRQMLAVGMSGEEDQIRRESSLPPQNVMPRLKGKGTGRKSTQALAQSREGLYNGS